MRTRFGTILVVIIAVAAFAVFVGRARAGMPPASSGNKVLAPITQNNLTIFPVVSSTLHDTRIFMTLDEGLRSGEVVITEAGQAAPLLRRRPLPIPRGDGAQVNRLVLVNNSDRPLILLAGEIVTGGKQDRVVGKDRIIPAKSDPVDLSVFCVEPGRWTGVSQSFGLMGGPVGAAAAPMAQPSVRARAMADKNQQQVWNEVHKSAEAMSAAVGGTASAQIAGTSSYARVMGAPAVKQQVDEVALPVERSYQSVIRRLRDQNAVGVVVAINGEIVWADVFASTPLLEKYWPKLVRSYAAEALTNRNRGGKADVAAAQAFLDDLSGTREVVESEPGVYRHTEIAGPGFRAFELASLLPKTNYDVHFSKMAE